MTRRPPQAITSPKPLPTPLAMSAAPTVPTPSPLPIRSSSLKPCNTNEEHNPEEDKLESATRPHPKPVLPKCKLRLICNNLDHEGSSIFFSNINPTVSLSQAVDAVLSMLYQPTKTNNHIPPTRSVSLTLRSMGGVAYTTGSDIDDDHKEIHFSLDYIKNIASERQQQEIQGVLVHEMVHCWQWNGLGTSPGGLIEGIADFVRLKAGLAPPHWKKEAGGEWDAGYQHTGYFLEWIEESFGEGSVRKINATLQNKKYVEEEFWQGLFQKNVADLWAEYSNTLPKAKERDENTEADIDEEMKAHNSKVGDISSNSA